MSEMILKLENEHDFELLFSLEKDRFDILLSKLKDYEPGLSPREIAENLYKELDITSDDLEKIIKVVYGINQAKLSSDFETEKVIDDFLKALQKFKSKVFKSEHSKEYLSRILNAEGSIFLTVSAKNLVYSRERILTDTDIETDARPIFKDAEFKGLVIIHTLKIDFIENGKDEGSTIRVALDKNDMDKLEKLIQQAKSRELSLKNNISNTFVEIE